MSSLKLEKTSPSGARLKPGIYRRGNRYVATWRVGGKEQKKFTKTIREAEAHKKAMETDRDRGEYRELSQETKRGINADTRDDYRKALEWHAIPFLGRKKLAEIEPLDLVALAEEISRSGVSAGTVRNRLAPVKALLGDAQKWGLIRANPGAGLRIAQPEETEEETEEEVRVLARPDSEGEGPDELAQLLAELPPEWRPFFEFLAETALRISEAIEVRWKDIDFGAKPRLNVQRQRYRGKTRKPKGRKARRIPLSRELAQALWPRRGDAEDLLFPSSRGNRLDPSNVMCRVLKPAAVRAGLGEWEKGRAKTWVGFHTFRHTAATTLFRSGWNAKQVQRFLGHSDAGFTLRVYVHLLDEDLPAPPSVGIEWAAEGATGAAEGAAGEAETGRNEQPPLAVISAS